MWCLVQQITYTAVHSDHGFTRQADVFFLMEDKYQLMDNLILSFISPTDLGIRGKKHVYALLKDSTVTIPQRF